MRANAYNLSQGKRLYSWFGCKACHGDGQGGAGPAFLDGWWNYGPEMVSIFASIRDGRPHGMPAFSDKMTTEQIWQLAGYVQTIGAYSAKTAAPSRNDEKQTRPAENRAPAAILFDQGPTPVHQDQGPTAVSGRRPWRASLSLLPSSLADGMQRLAVGPRRARTRRPSA